MFTSPEKYRNSSIYSIFVRNYSAKGTFHEVVHDLERIKAMGFDIIWLMPIHPIGKKNRKGSLGSPYSISDFFKINPEYGTENDFKSFIQRAHELNLKVIIDVVYHHTSWDSRLMDEKPDWFYHKKDGTIGNKVGDWSDIADLDFRHSELWHYLYDALEKWASIGVDGFRCDVAPLIPIEFWKYARNKIESNGYELIWLSESVEPSFITYLRHNGFNVHSDSEVYSVFDMLYDYDIKNNFLDFVNGGDLTEYLNAISRQEYTYPKRYVKMRYMENHDNPRAKFLIKNRRRLINFTAFMMFLKGSYLFYNGQETMTDHVPGLFDKDTIKWEMDQDIIELTKALNKIKKMDFIRDGNLYLNALTLDTAEIKYEYGDYCYTGLFNIGMNEESSKNLINEITTDKENEILFSGSEIIAKGISKLEPTITLPLIYKSKRIEKNETGIIS